MSSKRNIVLLGSLLLVILAVSGWFLLLSPRMATAGEIDSQRESAAISNDVTRTKIAELKKMEEEIAEAKANADLLTKRFPPTAAESELFGLFRRAAANAGMAEKQISTLTITEPAIGATDGSVTLSGNTDAEAPTTAAADPATTGTVPTPTTPAAGASAGGQLATMNVDVSISGNQYELAGFLRELENMDRAFLVTSVNLGSAQGGSGSLTLTGQMFLLPELVDPTAPVETPTETPTGTPTVPGEVPATPTDGTVAQ